MTDPKPAGNWITHVPPAILIVLAGAAIGYIKTDSDRRHELAERDIAKLEAQLLDRKDFMFCAVRMVDWLEDDKPGERPCKLEVMQ